MFPKVASAFTFALQVSCLVFFPTGYSSRMPSFFLQPLCQTVSMNVFSTRLKSTMPPISTIKVKITDHKSPSALICPCPRNMYRNNSINGVTGFRRSIVRISPSDTVDNG